MTDNNIDRARFDKPYPATPADERVYRGYKQQLTDMFRVAGESKETTQDKTCLELGCGTGEETLVLVREFGLRVTALDYNEESIAIARARVPEAQFRSLDLQAPYLLGTQFDFVFSKGVLHHLHDRQDGFLGAFLRVQPGGKLIVRVNWLYGWMFKKGWMFAVTWLLYHLIPDTDKRIAFGKRWIQLKATYHGSMPYEVSMYDRFGSIYSPMTLRQIERWCGGMKVIGTSPHHGTGLRRLAVQWGYMLIRRNQLTLTVALQKP